MLIPQCKAFNLLNNPQSPHFFDKLKLGASLILFLKPPQLKMKFGKIVSDTREHMTWCSYVTLFRRDAGEESRKRRHGDRQTDRQTDKEEDEERDRQR